MSRTSKTLLRLGVPSLAAATLVAGIPALLGTAQAAPIGTLTITAVDGTTGAAGSCQAFYVDATAAAAGASTAGERVNVILSTTTSTATADAAFCTLPTTVGTSTVTPASGSLVGTQQGATGSTTAATRTDQAQFTLGTGPTGSESRGRVVVGITRNEPGTASIQAYTDLNNNASFDVAAGENQATSGAITFTAGGPAGTNDNQNAVTAITASGSGTDTVQNEARTYTVSAVNGAADPSVGVTVNYIVTTGTNSTAPTVLGVTDNDGEASGTISLPNVGSGSTITFYVNQSDQSPVTSGPDTGDAQTTLTPVVTQAPTARTLVLTARPDTDTATLATPAYQETPAINPRQDGARDFRAVVDNGTGSTGSTVGTDVRFSVSGGSGDETVTPRTGLTQNNTATVSNTTDSFVDVLVEDPTPVSGEVLTITSTVRGQTTNSTATLTFVAGLSDARNIDLAPATTTTPVGAAKAFTATVTDFRGQPVVGAVVTFSETGPGAFRNGESSFPVTTNRAGVATAEVIAAPAESGVQTITASITGTGNRTGDAVGTPFGTTRAGNRTATATNTVVPAVATATPTVSATPTAGTPTPRPTGITCTNPAGITLDRSVTRPGRPVKVTVRSAPNSVVELLAYSRPSTTYRTARTAPVGASGVVEFMVVPGTNTRLFAQCVSQTRSASASVVINVRTAISLTVVRNSTRNYTFKGTILPRRAGQLISLYRVNANGTRVLSAQVKTDASGVYSFNRRFTGSGVFGFVTRTGQNLTNAAGESNTPDNSTTGVGTPRRTAIF